MLKLVPNHYRFISRWCVKASAEEVFDILRQPLEYPRWWPSVYLGVHENGPGHVRVLTRGWLPYTLTWYAREIEAQPPNLLVIEARGDLIGRGIWSIVPDEQYCDISFDWKVTVEKPLLRRLSLLLKPAFEANHRWAMEQGQFSLELELERYRAHSVQEMNLILGAPPAHVFLRPEMIGEALLAVAVLVGFARSGA